jgi:hypothetical protein
MRRWAFRAFDVLRGPRIFEVVWHILARMGPLNGTERDAASAVLGRDAIRYDAVRVAEGRLLSLVFRLNGGRAFTTFHTINLPSSTRHSSSHLGIVVHESTHVYQFEVVGSIYIYEAIRAQRTTGYAYGGWQQLQEDWRNGRHFKDYNREQQGLMAQDYYTEVVEKGRLPQDPIRQAYEPFIAELRSGDL